MDAMSPLDDELAALRRRAYGPDADIGDDPPAQARLAHLERLQGVGARSMDATAPDQSERATMVGEAPERDAVTGGAEPEGASGGTEAAESTSLSTSEKSAPDPAPSPMRRALPWVVAAVAAVVALVAGIALWVDSIDSLNQPQVEAQLAALDAPPTGAVAPGLRAEDLQFLETPDPVFVSHGKYGELAVWSTTAPHNWRCLAVVFHSEVWRFNCTVSSMDTVADVVINSDLLPTDAPGGPIPEWSTIRLVLHDDVVDVYIGRNDDPD